MASKELSAGPSVDGTSAETVPHEADAVPWRCRPGEVRIQGEPMNQRADLGPSAGPQAKTGAGDTGHDATGRHRAE